MADTQNPETDDTTAETTDQTPETPQPDQPDQGRGSKDAILADLARERDKRHQLEESFGRFREGLAAALGITDDKQVSPDELADQLEAERAEKAAAARELAALRAIPDGVDREALMDSRAFRAALDGVEPAQAAEVVASFVADNPRFRVTSHAAARDLAEPATATPTDPLLAALTNAVT